MMSYEESVFTCIYTVHVHVYLCNYIYMYMYMCVSWVTECIYNTTMITLHVYTPVSVKKS